MQERRVEHADGAERFYRDLAAQGKKVRVGKQKTDRQDAQHILRSLLKDDFPQIWVPSWENRDLRQLLWQSFIFVFNVSRRKCQRSI